VHWQTTEAAPPETPGPNVGPSGDPLRPVAIRLDENHESQAITRADAWLLWYLLQQELVRTLPYPPSYRSASGT
jgi:hypothetical protein